MPSETAGRLLLLVVVCFGRLYALQYEEAAFTVFLLLPAFPAWLYQPADFMQDGADFLRLEALADFGFKHGGNNPVLRLAVFGGGFFALACVTVVGVGLLVVPADKPQ